MSLIDDLAEQKILAAMANGAFDGLPGQGRPLQLDDDSMVPEHLRAGYRLLKNAGFVPPTMEWSRQLRDVEDLIAQLPDVAAPEAEWGLAERRLRLLQSRLRQGHAAHRPAWIDEPDYRESVLRRLARPE